MTHELRDSAEARRHVLQSLWLARVAEPTPENAVAALSWSLEIASSGAPLPSCGFIADVGRLAFGVHHEATARPPLPSSCLPASLVRKYEDYVLGKLYADLTFERGADALLRYQGRDRVRGLAYLVDQFRQRAGFGGVLLSPAVVKSLSHQPGDELLDEGWQAIEEHGLSPLLVEEYEQLVATVQTTGEVLGAEDIFELEHGTALAEFGERLALRQVLQAAEQLAAGLPRVAPRAARRHHQVASRILDEDRYPVGGFSSISTRGSIESLLHSQLALIEPDDRPDLFDVKFVRDELLYYSRDENQFLRRRLTFVFVLHPDLVQTRIKDAELPWQRIILTLASLLVLVRKLTEWLSHDALRFEIVLLESATDSLRTERELLRVLLREQLENDTAGIANLRPEQLSRRVSEFVRGSLCHCLSVSSGTSRPTCEAATMSELQIAGPIPGVVSADGDVFIADESGLASWRQAVTELLLGWL